jgi:hypothetical protein
MPSEVRIDIAVTADGIERRRHTLNIVGEAGEREGMLNGALAIVDAVQNAVERVSAGERVVLQ